MTGTFSVPPSERRQWITPIGGKLYPDYLQEAKLIYSPILVRFGELLDQVRTSEDLLRAIAKEPGPKMAQLAKMFRLYVSPHTSVEMLRRRTKVEEIIEGFRDSFRAIQEVRTHFKSRSIDDEGIIVRLYEYRDRGQKGYEVTRLFFEWFENAFGSAFQIEGPRGAGRDIYLPSVLESYPYNTPVDFIV
ncbi:MAG: hypothetical protein ACE5JU_24485 [Candidatus Binatia bacterium]